MASTHLVSRNSSVPDYATQSPATYKHRWWSMSRHHVNIKFCNCSAFGPLIWLFFMIAKIFAAVGTWLKAAFNKSSGVTCSSGLCFLASLNILMVSSKAYKFTIYCDPSFVVSFRLWTYTTYEKRGCTSRRCFVQTVTSFLDLSFSEVRTASSTLSSYAALIFPSNFSSS